SFFEAVEFIHASLGLSRGQAQVKLRKLCAKGKVQSFKTAYDVVDACINFESPERIAPKEWREHEVDVNNEEYIWVSKDDLDHSLGKAEEKPTNERDAAIMQRLKAGQRPGKDIRWNRKVFSDRVRNDCGKAATERGFSEETITKVTRQFMRSLRL